MVLGELLGVVALSPLIGEAMRVLHSARLRPDLLEIR
jgi:hypothetical protein